MTLILRKIFFAFCGVVLLAASAWAQTDNRAYLIISGQSNKKIPVAVPDFQPLIPGKTAGPGISQSLPQRLTNNLDMTGFFIPLDKRTFVESDSRAGLGQGDSLNYREWLAVGSEFLVKGGYDVAGQELTLELRLYDVVNRKMLFGKRYDGGLEDGRRMINRFTNDILYLLTGEPGIFGTTIAFVGGSRSKKQVYMTEFGADEVSRISAGAGPCMMPAVSPTGGIAYVCRDGVSYQLKMGAHVIASGPLYVSPAFTPTGELLAAISGPGDTNLYRFPGIGGRPVPITKHWGINISPTVSPDGARMAFVSDRAGGAQIYITSINGGKARRLTTNGRENTDPAWSPRGNRIAFVRDGKDIFTINPDGTGEIQLTAGSGRNTRPTWSPDGRMIVFASTRNGRSQIFTMTSYGERQMPLMPQVRIEQRTPFWSPARPDFSPGS